MALALIAVLVLGPLALLAVDLLRGAPAQANETTPAPAVRIDVDGYRIRAPRPAWPAPARTRRARTIAPATGPGGSGFRSAGGRRDYFGDGMLDRPA